MTFISWDDLPPEVRVHFDELEDFIGDLDGKTVGTPTDDDTFIDEGTVDAEDAVKAVNGIIEFVRSALKRP